MQIERIQVEALMPYARNSRTHSDAQLAVVVESIKRFGFTNPVLIRQGTIIAGHGRVLAAKKMGMVDVPCIRLDHLTDDEARAYVIADNKIAALGGWDDEMLALELKGLQDAGFNLGLTGFSDDEIADLTYEEAEGNTGEDEVPAVQAEVVTQLGDVWVLGNHRIMCGDSTDGEMVRTLLGGGMPHLMVTDPPYGVEYDPSWRAKAGVNLNKAKLGKVLNDDRADWREAWALFPGDVAYVWHASLFTREVLESLEACEFEHRSMIIWAKDRFTLGRGHYHWHHEPAWYVVKKGRNAHWQGDRSQSTLWSIPARDDSGHGHGTQKPVECMKRPIENNSKPGDSVYEPFSGSGTTIIASEKTGRRCYAMELSPQYVDVAIRRWQQFTGKCAVREADGFEFPAEKIGAGEAAH